MGLGAGLHFVVYANSSRLHFGEESLSQPQARPGCEYSQQQAKYWSIPRALPHPPPPPILRRLLSEQRPSVMIVSELPSDKTVSCGPDKSNGSTRGAGTQPAAGLATSANYSSD